jgi:uncharacterized protein (TIGR02145 family)
MRTIKLFFLLAPVFLACAGLHAQVTIGGLTDPAPGALLDLNSTVKGGLLLSNVSITNQSKIPTETNLFPGITAGLNDDNNSGFKGAIVYNTNPDTGVGIYVWTGTQWIPAGTNILYDAEGNDYTIGYFGDAGCWMTQNLRSTQYDDDEGTTLEMGASTYTDEAKYYNYPGLAATDTDRKNELSTEQLEAYGLLYTWTAASGRTDNIRDNDGGQDGVSLPGYGNKASTTADYHQGICPDGWHLPSDYEWSQLEIEIALHPEKYSSQKTPYVFTNSSTYDNLYTQSIWRPGSGSNENETDKRYWGRQMKSQTSVNGQPSNGTSNERNKNGFDVLLVGIVQSSGTANNYGSYAFFWSSSSYATYGVTRHLLGGNTGMYRVFNGRGYLFSVRCKKN